MTDDKDWEQHKKDHQHFVRRAADLLRQAGYEEDETPRKEVVAEVRRLND